MEKNLSWGHVVNHKSHTEWPGAEPGSPWFETGDYLSHGTDKWNKQKEERTSSQYLSVWTEYIVSSSTNSMQKPWSREKLLPLSSLCISVWNSSARYKVMPRYTVIILFTLILYKILKIWEKSIWKVFAVITMKFFTVKYMLSIPSISNWQTPDALPVTYDL